MHRRVAALGVAGESVLEVGAGTLNHVPYETRCKRYDFVEPYLDLYRSSDLVHRVSEGYEDIFHVPADRRYNRVFSIAVLEHLTHLPAVVARCGQMLSPGGVFQAGIPSEGGMLWGLAWRCITGPAYRFRTGLDYGSLMRYEHVNTAREILAVTGYLFEDVKIARFPSPLHHLSFYCYLEARRPVARACDQCAEPLAEGL